MPTRWPPVRAAASCRARAKSAAGGERGCCCCCCGGGGGDKRRRRRAPTRANISPSLLSAARNLQNLSSFPLRRPLFGGASSCAYLIAQTHKLIQLKTAPSVAIKLAGRKASFSFGRSPFAVRFSRAAENLRKREMLRHFLSADNCCVFCSLSARFRATCAIVGAAPPSEWPAKNEFDSVAYKSPYYLSGG